MSEEKSVGCQRRSSLFHRPTCMLMTRSQKKSGANIAAVWTLKNDEFHAVTESNSRTRCPQLIAFVTAEVLWISHLRGAAVVELTIIGEWKRTTRLDFVVVPASTQLHNTTLRRNFVDKPVGELARTLLSSKRPLLSVDVTVGVYDCVERYPVQPC